MLSSKSNDGAKAFAREGAKERLDFLNSHLAGRDYLIDRFSVADAYLFVMLMWAKRNGMDLPEPMPTEASPAASKT